MRRTTLPLGLVVGLPLVLGLGACGTAAPGPSRAVPTAPVPWRPLPATHPAIPFTIVPRKPDPAQARLARPCRGSDLDLRWRGVGGAAGTMVENVVVALTPGHHPCAVRGRAELTARTIEGARLPGSPSMWSVRSLGPVLLTRRQRGLVQLTWPSVCASFRASDRSRNGWFTLHYGQTSWTHPVPDLSATCHFEPDRRLGSIGVSRFVPLHVRPSRRITAYDSVRLRAPRQLVARRGRPIDFVVTLVASHDVALDPCPDYRLGTSPGTDRRYALNCASVPWRDVHDRPYLPAARPVRFAMHVGRVDARVAKLWWGLVAPGSPPLYVGLVTTR